MEPIVMRNPKDAAESTRYRDIGNIHSGKKTAADYLTALKMYNKAICCAPINSEIFYRALDNRSSVYYRLGMYDVCLDNINLIYKYGHCPSIIKNKLQLCEEACKNFIAEGKHPKKYVPIEPKLSSPAKENLTSVANCLEMHSHEQYGHHLVTNRDLKVGEIVSIAEPLYTVLLGEYQYERCENCGKENSQNLIPCAACTATMFCDEKCLNEAMDSFHKYECLVINRRNIFFRAHQKLTLRIMMSGLSSFETIDEFLDFSTRELKKKSKSAYYKDAPKYERDKYELVCLLPIANSIHILRGDIDDIMKVCTYIFTLKKMSSKKQTAEFKKSLKNILHSLMLIVKNNMTSYYNICDGILDKRFPDDNRDGRNLTIFHFRRFLRHSCVPNVLFSQNGNKVILSIVRPIKAGDPLLLCFYKGFCMANLQQRRAILPFSCHCIACTENYPVEDDLPTGSFIYPEVLCNKIYTLDAFDRTEAIEHFDLTVNTMEDNDGEMPCQRLAKLFRYYGIIMDIIYCDAISIALLANEAIVKNY